MKETNFLAILLILILASCSRQFNPSFEYVVFNIDSLESAWKPDDLLMNYELTDSDFFDIEEILEDTVSKRPVSEYHYLKLSTLSKFKRQYVAYKSEDGKIIVWVYGICELFEVPTEVSPGKFEMKPVNWKSMIVDPNDADDCYWRLKISDLRNKDYHLF